mmetsp:Transcript_29163/g.21708  ORF Transcript_29163/g.21708 Transcript_29163/m.21708 type:complete len:169 (+) Transcript_29163:178-684(+)
MEESKGRDKVFGLVQYIVELYVNCMKYSQEYAEKVSVGEIESVQVGKRVVKHLSSGRKVFKFMKFVDMVTKAIDLLNKEHHNHGIFITISKLIGCLVGFLYYLLDNIVWFCDIGMISKTVFKTVKWKRIKDALTLSKNWVQLVQSLVIWYRQTKAEEEILGKLKDMSD